MSKEALSLIKEIGERLQNQRLLIETEYKPFDELVRKLHKMRTFEEKEVKDVIDDIVKINVWLKYAGDFYCALKNLQNEVLHFELRQCSILSKYISLTFSPLTLSYLNPGNDLNRIEMLIYSICGNVKKLDKGELNSDTFQDEMIKLIIDFFSDYFYTK